MESGELISRLKMLNIPVEDPILGNEMSDFTIIRKQSAGEKINESIIATITNVNTLQKNIIEIDKKSNLLIKEHRELYFEIKTNHQKLCFETSDFCVDQLVLFENLENRIKHWNHDMKIKYIIDIIEGMKIEKCMELSKLCEKIQQDLIELKIKVENKSSKKVGIGAIIGASIGLITGIGIAILCPFLIPVELGILIGLGTVSAAGAGLIVSCYQYYRNRETIKFLNNMVFLLADVKSNIRDIKFQYDKINKSYKIIKKDIINVQEISENEIDYFVEKIENERPKIIISLNELHKLTSLL